MPQFCIEFHFGRHEGIVRRDLDIDVKLAAFIGRVLGSRDAAWAAQQTDVMAV